MNQLEVLHDDLFLPLTELIIYDCFSTINSLRLVSKTLSQRISFDRLYEDSPAFMTYMTNSVISLLNGKENVMGESMFPLVSPLAETSSSASSPKY